MQKKGNVFGATFKQQSRKRNRIPEMRKALLICMQGRRLWRDSSSHGGICEMKFVSFSEKLKEKKESANTMPV